MRTGLEVQPLEDAVEVVDDADEVAVGVDLGLARLDLQTEGASVAVALVDRWRIVVAAPRIAAEPRVVVPAVVAAVITTEPPRIEAATGDAHAAIAINRRRNRSAWDCGAGNRLVVT